MKIWLLTQTKNIGYDTFDSAVVAANTKEEAKLIHPNGGLNSSNVTVYYDWAASKYVVAELIGTAVKGTKKGVICASFNAG